MLIRNNTPQVRENLGKLAVSGEKSAASRETQVPAMSDTVEINPAALKTEQTKILQKSKIGAIVGTALGTLGGVAAGLAGGAIGAIVGLAVAPLGAVAGAVGGAIGGFHSAKLIAKTSDGATYLGIVTGAIGFVLGGTAGFYGGAALGAAAGASGGLLGVLGGVIGGATIGATLGGGGTAAYELSANKEQYLNLSEKISRDAITEQKKKAQEQAEVENLTHELGEKLKEKFGKNTPPASP